MRIQLCVNMFADISDDVDISELQDLYVDIYGGPFDNIEKTVKNKEGDIVGYIDEYETVLVEEI